MSNPRRSYLEQLVADVQHAETRSVLAEVIALADQETQLSDEQLRTRLAELGTRVSRLAPQPGTFEPAEHDDWCAFCGYPEPGLQAGQFCDSCTNSLARLATEITETKRRDG